MTHFTDFPVCKLYEEEEFKRDQSESPVPTTKSFRTSSLSHTTSQSEKCRCSGDHLKPTMQGCAEPGRQPPPVAVPWNLQLTYPAAPPAWYPMGAMPAYPRPQVMPGMQAGAGAWHPYGAMQPVSWPPAQPGFLPHPVTSPPSSGPFPPGAYPPSHFSSQALDASHTPPPTHSHPAAYGPPPPAVGMPPAAASTVSDKRSEEIKHFLEEKPAVIPGMQKKVDSMMESVESQATKVRNIHCRVHSIQVFHACFGLYKGVTCVSELLQ